MTLEAAFGNVIRLLRTERHLSQEKLAFESSLDRSYISQIECGHRQPTLLTIFQLAKALQIAPYKIIEAAEVLYNQ